MDKYTKKAVFSDLKKYDHIATDGDFIILERETHSSRSVDGMNCRSVIKLFSNIRKYIK